MRRPCLEPRNRWLICRAAALVLAHAAVAVAETKPPSCHDVAITEEQAHAIPGHLLRAIAAVESAGNPWSVNVDGAGHGFATKQQAIDFVLQARLGGARAIDVGCFQIDLFYHPEAFGDLQQAFDPAANAAYAAAFLSALHVASGDWGQAIADYHSRDPRRGGAYRDLVYAVPEAAPGPWPARVWAVPVRFGIRVVVPGEAVLGDEPAGAPRVFAP